MGFYGERPLWTVAEVAAFLGVSRATVYRLVGSGDLHLGHVRGLARVTEASLRAFMDRVVDSATPPDGLPAVPPPEEGRDPG